jgi:hypothetical protein
LVLDFIHEGRLIKGYDMKKDQFTNSISS